MLYQLGSYRLKHIVLWPNSGELILLAQCWMLKNFIDLEIIWKWTRWSSPVMGFTRQKRFIFPKPTLSSCRTTLSSRKVSLPADLDFALPGKWKDVPRWNSRPCLKNPSKSASIGKLWTQYLGNSFPSLWGFLSLIFTYFVWPWVKAFCGNTSWISPCEVGDLRGERGVCKWPI